MYLHIGKDVILNAKNLIGIFDISTNDKMKIFEKIIKELKEQKLLIDIEENIKKSLILTIENKKTKGYISNISSTTLLNRLQ